MTVADMFIVLPVSRKNILSKMTDRTAVAGTSIASREMRNARRFICRLHRGLAERERRQIL
jgi:hypothetical protein